MFQKLAKTFCISILLQPITSAKCTKCIFITWTDHRSNDFQDCQEDYVMNDIAQLAGEK